MKILRITSLGYVEGGVESELAVMQRILEADGHVVKTISSDAGPEFEHFTEYEFHIPRSFIGQIIARTFNVQAYRLVKRVCSDFQPDVVTFHTLFLPSA